jgi:outer membrane protein assembly factor BamB
VLSGTRVLVTAQADDGLATRCLDRASGALVWRAAVPRARAAPHHEHNSPAAPSVAVGTQRVVAFFPDFGLVAYDHDGAERWRRPLGPFETNADYGLAASPIVEDGKVILALDEHRRSVILALREEDGAELWRGARPAVGGSWSTPVIHAPREGPKELIHTVGMLLEALELDTGRRIRWTRGTLHEPISGATVADGIAYLVGFGPPDEQDIDGALVRGVDADGDGRIALEELPAWKLAPRRTAALFDLADRDADGGLDAGEAEQLRAIHRHYMMIGSGTRSVLAVRLAGSGDVTDESYVWTARGPAAPEVMLPVVYGDAVYFAGDSGGVVTRLDRASGAVLARERIDALRDACFASPVAGDGKLCFVSHGGTLVVLATDTLEVLGTSELGEACYATPALADGHLYVRTDSALHCFTGW